MRKNHIRKNVNAYENFDRVYVPLPQIPFIDKIVACPLKTVYINTCASGDAHICRLFASVDDLEDFCERYRIELG